MKQPIYVVFEADIDDAIKQAQADPRFELDYSPHTWGYKEPEVIKVALLDSYQYTNCAYSLSSVMNALKFQYINKMIGRANTALDFIAEKLKQLRVRYEPNN